MSKIFISIILLLLGVIIIMLPAVLKMPDPFWASVLSQLGLTLVSSSFIFLTAQLVFDTENQKHIDHLVSQIKEKIDHNINETQESFSNIASSFQTDLAQTSSQIAVSFDDKQIEFNQSLNENLKLLNDVKLEIQKINQQNFILKGANASEIVEIYKDRDEAFKDIYDEVEQTDEVSMMGIALSSFFNPTSRKAIDLTKWANQNKKLKILLINPYSLHAIIRAQRENKKGNFTPDYPYEQSGLYKDVISTIENLYRSLDNGKIEARMYSSPNLFLVITPNFVFVELYHYGIEGSPGGGSFPVLKFPANANYSQMLKEHFKFIWDNHSDPLESLLKKYMVGTEKNALDCGLINLFTTRENAKKRIQYVLENAKNEIYILGISLRKFFHPDQDFYSIIQRIAEGNTSTVKALLLNPLSEQGKLRSLREQPNFKIKDGILYTEVKGSLNTLEKFSKNGSISAKLYSGAPSCFMVLTENSVIVEQYHYGKIDKQRDYIGGSTIVGGKVPILEYSKEASASIYDEFKGHFEYLWDELSIDVNKWKETAENWTE